MRVGHFGLPSKTYYGGALSSSSFSSDPTSYSITRPISFREDTQHVYTYIEPPLFKLDPS